MALSKGRKYFEKLLKDENTEDLFEWLGKSDDISRNLGEMSPEESEALSAELFSLGAEKVWACDIERASDEFRYENSSTLCIALPTEASLRENIFSFSNEIIEDQGFDPEEDKGQEFLLFSLD